jgi:hypothetical protein
MRRVILIILFALTLGAGSVFAGMALSQMPRQGPELKRLGYFVGKWHGEGEMKPGPFGPGGKFTESQDVQWMPGGFFLEINADEGTPMGNGKALMIMGYDSEKKAYTFSAFNSMGQNEVATGTVDGNTWTWLSDSVMGGKAVKTKYTMKEQSPTSYTTKFEMSSEGGPWTTIMEGTTSKVK